MIGRVFFITNSMSYTLTMVFFFFSYFKKLCTRVWIENHRFIVIGSRSVKQPHIKSSESYVRQMLFYFIFLLCRTAESLNWSSITCALGAQCNRKKYKQIEHRIGDVSGCVGCTFFFIKTKKTKERKNWQAA